MPHDVMQQIQQEKLNVQESGNEVLADSLGRIQQYAKNSVEDLNALNVIVKELTSGGNNLSNSIDKVVYYFEKYKSVSKQATDSTNIFRSSYEGLGSRSSSQLKKLTSSLQEVKEIQTELGSNFKFSATDNVVLLTRQISKLKNTLKGLGNIELNVSPKNLPKFQTGGKVTGGPSSGDKILARLNAGQYVFNKRQMSNLGRLLGQGKQLSHQQVFKLAGGKPVVQKQGQIPKFATGGQIEQRRRRYMSDIQLQTQSNDVNQKIYQRRATALSNAYNEKDDSVKKVYQEQNKLLYELQRSYRSLSKDKQRLIQIDESKLDSIEGIEKQIQKIRQLNQFYEDLNEEVNKFTSQSAKNLQQQANMASISAKNMPKGSKERKEQQKRVKQYALAANVAQSVYKNGNKTSRKQFEALSQQLSVATDSKDIEKIVSAMKELNTQIQKGQVKVKGFENVMGGMKKEAENMAKQFNDFFGGTPVGMAAVAAGIMLVGQQIKKLSDELANSIVQMSKMNVQMSMLKNTSANSFGSKDAIEGFRNEFSLTREQIGKLAPQMSRFVTEGNKSFSTLQTLADNLKDSFGQLDIATFEKMMNLLKELPQKQIQVLMGVNTDSIDKMNTYANLLKNGRLSETLEIYQKGGFGEVEGMEGASKGEKEAVKTQREIKKEIEDIKYFLFGMLPDFVKSGTVMVSLIGGLVVSVGAIIASAMKNTMALGMIAKNSFRTYGKGDVVPVIESNFGGSNFGGKGKGKGWTPTRLGAKIGGKTGAKIGRSIGKMAGPASAALVGLGVGLTVADMLGSHFHERRMKEVNYKREKRIEQEEKNKNSLQNKLKTGDELTLQDFNLGKTSDSLKEQQLLKRKADYGNTGGKWGGAIGGAAAGLGVGAAIGSVVPLVGTIIGGAIGGLVGGIGGYFAGDAIGQAIAESEEEKKFKSQDNAISVAKKQLKDALGVNAQSRIKERNRVVNDSKYLRGIEAVLKQIKNDSLTAIYTQNMQAIKGQMQVMNLLGGSRTIFESLRKSMLRNASDKMNTKLLALNQQYDKVSKSDMSYEAKMNAANVLQIQRAKSISEFVQTVQESIGKYEEIPQVILNGIKEKINSLNFENLSKGFIGTSTQTFDMLKENLENSLSSVNYAFNSFVEDQEKILNARNTLNNQKEEVVRSLGDEYVKNGQIDQEKIAKQLQENESLISTMIQTAKEKSVTQKDIEKKDLEKTYLEKFENSQKNLSLKDKTEGTVAEKWDQIGKLKNYANDTIKQLTELKGSKSLSDKEKEHIDKQIESITALRKKMDNMDSDNYSFARQQDFENSIKGFAIASTRFNYSAMTDEDRQQINDLQNKNLLFKRAQGVYGTEQFEKSSELKSIENFQNETTKLKENLNKFVEGLKNNPVVLYYQAQERVFKQNQKYMDSAFGSALGSVMVLESKRKQWIGILESIPETTKELNEQYQSILNQTVPISGQNEEQKQYIEKQRNLVKLRMKALSGDTNAEGQSIKLNEEIKAMESSDNIKQLQNDPIFKAYLSEISSFSQTFEKLNSDVAKVRSQLVTSIRESSKLYDEIKNSSVVYSSTKKIQAGESQVALSSYDLDVDKVTSTLRDLFKQTVDRYEEQKKQIYETTKARKKDAEARIKELKKQYALTENKDKLKEIQVAERQYSNIDVQEQKRLADLELKKKQDVVKFAQQQRDLKLKILDYESQSIEIQRDLASSIGAPLQTVLSLEQQMVDNAKKKLQTEQATLDYMIEKGIQGQALREQELRVEKQRAEVIKNAMGAQRSALQKLMGNVFGQFTKFSWMGTSNKAKIFGQGYMETSGGMTVSTGGVYTGGYQSRVASANANGGIDPLTGQSYNAGGAAKRIPLGQTDSTAKDKSAKDDSKKDEKGAKGTETTPDDPIAKIVHQREQKKKQMAKKQELEIPALQATIKTANIVEKIYNLLVDSFGDKKEKKKNTSSTSTPTTPTTPASSGSGTSTSVKDATPKDTPVKDTTPTTPTSSGTPTTPTPTTPTTSGNEVVSATSSKKEQKKNTSVKDESTTKGTKTNDKGEFKGSLRTSYRDLKKREQQLKNSREQQIQIAPILDEYSVKKANISNAQDGLSSSHEILSSELEQLQKDKQGLLGGYESGIKKIDEEIARLEGDKAKNNKAYSDTEKGINSRMDSDKKKLEGQFEEEKKQHIAQLQARKKAAQKILSERKQWIKKGDFELAYNGVTLADDQANETRYHDNTGRYDYKLLEEIISDMNTQIEFAKKQKVGGGVSFNDTTDEVINQYRGLSIKNDEDYGKLLALQTKNTEIESALKRLRAEKEKIENDKSQQVSNVETEIDSKRIQIEDVKAQQETLSQEQKETDTVYLKKLQENGMTGVNSLQEAQVAFNNKKSENNDEEEKIKRDRETMLQYIADKTNTVYQETKHNFETVQFNQAMRDLHEGKVKKGDENYLQTLIMATKGKDEILKFVHSNQDPKKFDYKKVFQMQKEVAKVKEQRRQTIDSIYEHLPESIYKGQRMNLLRSADLQRKFGVKNYEQLQAKTKGMSNQQLSSMLEQERNARNARIREKLNSYGGGDNWAGVKGIGTGHMEQAKSIMSSVKGVSMGFNPFGGGRKETQLDRSRSGNTSEGQKQDKMKVTIQFDTQGDNIVAKVKQIAMQNAQQITNEGMRRS